MLINLTILRLVALIITGTCAIPITSINSPKDGDLHMYELLDEYFRDKDMHKNIGDDKYPLNDGDLEPEKRGKYSWSVAYGKRDRWIAYGKRNSHHNGQSQGFVASVDVPRDLSIYNNEVKRQQAWRTRWGKKRTTVPAFPTTRAMNNYDSNQSYEGYFTKNPKFFKPQQWTKYPWGNMSY